MLVIIVSKTRYCAVLSIIINSRVWTNAKYADISSLKLYFKDIFHYIYYIWVTWLLKDLAYYIWQHVDLFWLRNNIFAAFKVIYSVLTLIWKPMFF